MRRARFYDRRRDRGKPALAGLLVASVLAAWQLLGPRAALGAETVQPNFEGLEQKATPEETYGANAFSIVSVTGGGGYWRPVRGIYRISTEPDVFFRALGRKDLAHHYSRRHGTGVLLRGLSYVAGLSGLGLLAWGISEGKAIPAIAGVGLLVGWPVLDHVGSELQKPDLPPDQALDLAGRYNEALRVKLGLSSPVDRGVISAAPRPTALVMVPLLSMIGAGVAVGGRF
jgi:hypothetical protein